MELAESEMLALRDLWSKNKRDAFNDRAIKRFSRHVVIAEGCWLWKGKENRADSSRFLPYGRYPLNGRVVSAHRIAFMLFKGPVLAGLVVRHRCDNPRCVNPDHLEVGTARENNIDTVERGRWVAHGLKGVRHGASKLTEAQVRTVRARVLAGVSMRQVALAFGVNGNTIRDIILGITWAHLS